MRYLLLINFLKNVPSPYKSNMKFYHSFKVQVQQRNNNLRPVALAIAIFKFKGPLPRVLYPRLTFLKVAVICFGMFFGYIHKNYSGTKTF